MGIISLSSTKRVVIIVAHPDDETLWAGGTILENPEWECLIISLCRGKDPDRSVRFRNALKVLNCDGFMGDIDDGPEQVPLDESDIDRTILELLPSNHFDLIITHDPGGEYTRHRRHEETGKSVIRLWFAGKISTTELWTFAYNDINSKYPVAIDNANIIRTIPPDIWRKKYNLITETYGFRKGGFEAETTPKKESFWRFTDPESAIKWIKNVEEMKERLKTKTL
jgi:LmbE family N-acetylglucosaminyl deacetylase